MIVTDILAKDFLSLGDVHVKVPKVGLVLVTGWDEDIGRANGAGKSSLFLALAWCIYGEVPRKITVAEIVRRGQSDCSVTVKFEQDGVSYVVTRRRPSGLDFWIGGEKQKGNPKYVQALIETIVGLSYEQFLITAYFPQNGDSSRFLKQNDAAAKDFLGTILNFNKTEQAYKKLHIEMKEVETQLAVKQSEVQAAELSVDRFKSIVDMPISAPPSKEEVLAVKADMEAVSLSTRTSPDTSTIDQDIMKVASAVERVRSSKYTVDSLTRALQEKKRRVERINDEAAHYLTCPSCSAELLESNGQLIEFDDAAAETVKSEKIERLTVEIGKDQDQIDKLSPLVAKESDFCKKLDDLKSKRMQVRHEYDLAMQKKSHLASQMKGFKKAFTSYQQAKQQKDLIAKQLADVQESIKAKVAELKALESEFALLSASKAVMSPTGLIAYSMDDVMSDLNDQVDQYLDIFSHGTMTYKISSGDDKAKVTHTVSKGGVDASVGSLSGGEERGLILSVDLGLSEVIATRSGVNLPSILMLDECFNGLDYVGKEKVIDALRELAKDRCIIVIDHSTEMGALFDQSIKVLKKNDVSSVVVE